MSYLVAKHVDRHGCIAIAVKRGKHLVELKRKLNAEVAQKGVQLVTISRPVAYGEYAPYTILQDEEEFVKRTLEMAI